MRGADGKARGASPADDALTTKVAASGNVVVAGDYAGKVIAWDGGKVMVVRGDERGRP